MNELDAARKELEKEPTKKGLFGRFGKSNKEIAKKKDWETYKLGDDSPKTAGASAAAAADGSKPPPSPRQGPYDDVLFDVDAIRAEIAAQAAEDQDQRDKNSNLAVPVHAGSNAANLRHVKSFDVAAGLKISTADPGSKTPNLSKPSSHKHTPSPPAKASHDGQPKDLYYYSDDEDEFGDKRNAGDGEIQMTFGRWDEPPPPKTAPFDYGANTHSSLNRTAATAMGTIPQRSSSFNFLSNSSSTTPAPTTNPAATSVLASSTALPSMSMSMPAIEPTRNVWADYDDYDDDEFGQEKEVTMSFA